MASPQKENGYVPIANEIIEALGSHRIPGECWQVLLVILRKTYGFNKREDKISVGQFEEITKMKKQNISRALMRLAHSNIVIKTDVLGRKGNMFKFNKDYDTWKTLVIKTDYQENDKNKTSISLNKQSKLITNVIKTDVLNKSKLIITKDKNIIKDKQKTGKRKSGSLEKKSGPAPRQVARSFFDCVVCLSKKEDHEFAETFKKMMVHIQETNPDMPKSFIWKEIQDFTRSWTELTHDGKREKWQIQKTFQVGGRLATWFGNVRKWQKKETIKNQSRKITTLDD